MNGNLVAIDPAAPDPGTIARAAELLRAGGLVAFPTETVYGLGAHALDAAAVRRIFAVKGRPSYNPLIVHVPDEDSARVLTVGWPESAARAAAAFWPGPLTLVLPRTAAVPDEVTGGRPTVAVRVPAHPVALALLRAAGVPVAAPSANRFTRVSPTSAAHVARGLGDTVDLILDGGVTPFGIESTVLDVSGERPRLLRHGAVTHAELAAVLGPVEIVTSPDAPGAAGAPLPAPGMLDRHYAPAGELVVFADPDAAAAMAGDVHSDGGSVGAIVFSRSLDFADEVVALPADARAYARLLYAALHALDDAGCDLILVERVPDSPDWAAVRDRLRRAARAGA